MKETEQIIALVKDLGENRREIKQRVRTIRTEVSLERSSTTGQSNHQGKPSP